MPSFTIPNTIVLPLRILLTGASSGIGRALALVYAERGARIVLVARRTALLDEVATLVSERGGDALVLAADLTEPDAPRRMIEQARSWLGVIDLAILNAGRGGPLWIHDMDLAEAELVTSLNYLAPLRMIALLLPDMLHRRQGHIAVVSSLAGFRGMPGSGPYNASKGALNILMESLRIELRGEGVAVTTVLPGFVRTGMTDLNEFHMPFLMEPERAARRIARDLDRRRSFSRFPFPVSLATRLLNILPTPLYDVLISQGRKRLARRRAGR